MKKLVVNLGLLLGGLLMISSGLLMQIKYHIGHHGTTDINNYVLGNNYIGWSNIHKTSIIFISIIIIIHVIQHWKWYITIIKKKLFSKNRQVLTLTLVFIIVAITGYIPWIIKLKVGDEVIRKIFIEIHDKLALILFVYLILHITKRLKWYFITFRKIK